ncbi:MAG: stage II sporulation protein M [Methanomicrobiales archaeon]|jgi:stage II sporulation protein M|nr:stage II sporulation protein M [Methanomicrobiales archaeon]
MSEGSLARSTLVAAVIFAISIGLGVFVVLRDPGIGADVMTLFHDQVAGQLLSDSPPVLAFKIFLNNLSACTLLFLGGASLGIATVLVLAVNGLLIGAVAEIMRQQQGSLFIAAALIPHGIFEIPSFLIAGGLGLLLGRALMAEWYGGGDAAAAAVPLARLFIRVVVPLLAVAAVVEVFITPVVVVILT